MLRHLVNLNQLVFYAGISCGIAFFTRLNPAFFYPVLLLRLSVLAYCFYAIAVERRKNRMLPLLVASALAFGWVGGYFDLLEVYLRFDAKAITLYVTVILLLPVILIAFYLQYDRRGKYRNR